MKYQFTNVLGTFVFNENGKLVKGKADKEISLHDKKALRKVLTHFKNDAKKFYEYNLKLTKKKIKGSVKKDIFVLQAINNIEEIDRAANMLAKRLREWYSYYLPEFSPTVESHEAFARLILEKSKDTLLKEIRVNKKDSMGAELSKEDLAEIKELAKEINNMYALRERHKVYLEKTMKKLCPNVLAVCGVLVGAKLLALAGSLRKLSLMPASVIQTYGAEKALFRHMKTGARPPKYGVIFNHPLITRVKKEDKGKAARTLADTNNCNIKLWRDYCF